MPYYQYPAVNDGASVSCPAPGGWQGDTDGLVYLIWHDREIPGREPLTPAQAATLGTQIAVQRGRDPALFLRDAQAWSRGRVSIPGAA